jgi:hypothetical protein
MSAGGKVREEKVLVGNVRQGKSPPGELMRGKCPFTIRSTVCVSHALNERERSAQQSVSNYCSSVTPAVITDTCSVVIAEEEKKFRILKCRSISCILYTCLLTGKASSVLALRGAAFSLANYTRNTHKVERINASQSPK